MKAARIALAAVALAGCSYVDASGGTTTADGGGTRWQVVSYNLFWGREVTLPSGATFSSSPKLEGLQYLPKRPGQTP